MKCDKCNTKKEMCTTQAYFHPDGIKSVYLCTTCGNTILAERYTETYLRKDYPELSKLYPPEMQLTCVKVNAKARKLKGRWSMKPGGEFLLTADDSPASMEMHRKFWEEMEKEPINEI